MSNPVLTSLSIILYMAASLLQTFDLKNTKPHFKLWILFLTVIALGVHAELLHHSIDLGIGQNLSFGNMLSLLIWVMVLLTLVWSFFRPVEALLWLLLPLAAISTLMAQIFQGHFIIDADNPVILTHIILGVLSFGILCMAGVQALLWIVLEHILRSRSGMGFHMRKLPPMETLEHLLFQTVRVGFALLTLVLLSSAYYYHSAIFEQSSMMQKSILAFMGWLIFAILLWGRWRWGWRGKRAIGGTLFGIILLITAYLGFKFLWNTYSI